MQATNQVPRKPVRLSADDQALIEFVAGPTAPVFPELAGAKRRYPGAPEGSYLATYLNELSVRPGKQKAFIKVLTPFWKEERGEGPKVTKPRQVMDALKTYARLKRRIDREGLARVTKGGLVVSPKTNEGKASLAALLLYAEKRLGRIRQCVRCGNWFFAHLQRQVFCGDPKKKCQWAHNHNPEWRKQYRERNRIHQKKYREGLFGKKQ
jgi:hypothetical protein